MSQAAPPAVDPELLAAWVRGWTLARGTALPEAYGSGWHVAVGWPEQRARYVFPGLAPELAALADEIGEPFIFLKACVEPQALAAALPAPWAVQRPGWLMTLDGAMPRARLPEGYRLAISEAAGVLTVRAIGADDATAAIGRVVETGGLAVFDRIETDPAHRRRGLASAVTAALWAVGRDLGAGRGALVATPEGRALYQALGWRVEAPYSTAAIAPG